MTHAFAFRAPLLTGSSGSVGIKARLMRLGAAGWHVSEPAPQTQVAQQGMAGFVENDRLILAGMVFLDDRAAMAGKLGREIDPDETDLDLALALRIARGPAFAMDLPGTFSIVVLDRVTGTLEGFRDHFGVFPFYYATAEDSFTCGSDIRSVLHLSDMPLSANPLRLADFIEGSELDTRITAYDGLQRLPTAHMLTLEGGTVDTKRYWTLNADDDPTIKDDVAASRLRSTLASAVDARLDAPGQVGAMLSGGLDSSSLAGLAAKAATDRNLAPVKTVSLVYGADKAYDETRFITSANDTFGTDPKLIQITAPPRLRDIGPLIEEQMELFLGFGLPKSRCIYPEASAFGLGALLDGHGGDEVISHGYGRLVELAIERRWVKLFRELRGAAEVHGTDFWSSYLSYILRYGGMRTRHPVQRVLRKVARKLHKGSRASGTAIRPGQLLSVSLAKTVEATYRYNTKPESLDLRRLRKAEKLAHHESLTNPLMQHGFEVLHRSAVSAGILPLYPFFDRRVVEACLAMPSDMKLRGGRTRWILREAMRGLLPEDIRTRPDKAEFGDEFAESVREYFRSEGLESLNTLGPFVDLDEARALWEQVSTKQKPENIDALRALWRLVILAKWLDALDVWQDQQRRGTLI